MIFVCVMILVAPPDGLQELRDIYAQEAEQRRLKVDAIRAASTFTASCSCGWTNHYTTPGRAKMGHSGHRRWCKS
jgi:hypothetical protein